ncbi:MAG TPA: nucleoside triphosphate pyrophosphohydrolase [Woeseiaceae bacterium]|nr:nucleoside triphosphate pyrophosphohydrolase [Woeseiaceae bacterium]
MRPIDKLLEIMATLRNPESGCPWDLRQDFASIAPYTIEEAYEVSDAIERGDMDSLRGELGDLLFQVVFHARMAEEAELFDFDDVATDISEKMIRRHPHLFGDDDERKAGKVAGSWDAIKAAERSQDPDQSALAGIAEAIPALMRARKLGLRASGVGFDWPDREGVRNKIVEEIGELEEAIGNRDSAHIREEFGDLLFSVVNLARHLEVDPEDALLKANRKFERRFRDMEAAVVRSGRSLQKLSEVDLEHEWHAAKKRLSAG